MKSSKLVIIFFVGLIVLPSCFKDEDSTPDYIKKSKDFGGNGLDYGKRITRTNDGGYLLVGASNSFGAGDKDVYVLKMDSDANVLWEQTYGGSEDEEVRDLLKHPDGSYYICGYTLSKGSGGADMMLIKISAVGEEQYFKTYGNIYYDMAFSVELSAENNLLLSGYVTDAESQVEHLNIREVAPDGTVIRSSIFESDTAEMAQKSITLSDGYLFSGKAIFSEDNTDILLFKTDFQGNMLWKKRFGGPGIDETPDMIETNTGNFILAGFSGSFHENRNNDLYLLEVSANGDSLTSSHYGKTETWDFEEGYAIMKSSTNEYFVSGRTKDAILVVKANANLEITHEAVYGREFLDYTAIGYDMYEKPDQTIAVVGGQPFSQEGDMIYVEIEPDTMEEIVEGE